MTQAVWQMGLKQEVASKRLKAVGLIWGQTECVKRWLLLSVMMTSCAPMFNYFSVMSLLTFHCSTREDSRLQEHAEVQKEKLSQQLLFSTEFVSDIQHLCLRNYHRALLIWSAGYHLQQANNTSLMFESCLCMGKVQISSHFHTGTTETQHNSMLQIHGWYLHSRAGLNRSLYHRRFRKFTDHFSPFSLNQMPWIASSHMYEQIG